MSQFYVTSPGGSPSIPVMFVTDNGTATASANILNVVTPGGGTQGIITSAPGNSNTILITVTSNVPAYTQVTSTTNPTVYVVSPTDYFLSCDSTLGLLIIQLPNAPTALRQFVIKDRVGQAENFNIEVTTVSGVVLIDGQDSALLEDDYDSVSLLFNGVGYEIE